MSVKRQLVAQGIPFRFYDAIRGDSLPASLRHRYSPLIAFSKGGSTLNLGEIGCFSSNFQIWLTVIEMGLPEVLVLDDDVDFLGHFFDLVAERRTCPVPYDVLHLTNRDAVPILHGRVSSFAYHWCYFSGAATPLTAYIITQNGAQLLSDGAANFWPPVDNFISFRCQHGLRLAGVSPSPVGPRPFESQIWRVPSDYVRHKRFQYSLRMRYSRVRHILCWARPFVVLILSCSVCRSIR